MIQIKKYDKENQKISFTTDMGISLANSIRRSVLEIPIMAIDEVEITKNDSALYDEILAHRIGLVPIETKGNKEIKFSLKEKGPKTVYSSEMKPHTGVDLKIPLVILNKDQEIEIVCDARLGKGLDHLKYSPGLAYYKHNIEDDVLDYIRIDEEGNVSFDEEDLKNKELTEEHMKKINDFKKAEEIEFFIESWGQIEAKEIFLKSIEALESNLQEFNKALK